MGSRSRISLPLQLEPQLCTLVPDAPAGDGWIQEIKWDGWRLLARKDGADVRLFARGCSPRNLR
jgi:bifunctional non-homologous end joining protein LigD